MKINDFKYWHAECIKLLVLTQPYESQAQFKLNGGSKMKLKSIVTAGALTLATLVSTQASAVLMSVDFATESGWLADGVNSGTRINSTATSLDCAAGATNATNDGLCARPSPIQV